MTNAQNNDSGDNAGVSLDQTLAGGLTAAQTGNDGEALRVEDLPPDAQELAAKPGRVLCGDIDMRIAANGTWFYLGSPIGRKELVKLFSSVVRRDDAGDYWMVTPAEMARIQVDDAPFTAVELITEGNGDAQRISFRTNVDAIVPLDDEHPLRVETDPESGEPRPYIRVKDRLEALIVRSVFYQLIKYGGAVSMDDEDIWGVWSNNNFYPIGPVETPE